MENFRPLLLVVILCSIGIFTVFIYQNQLKKQEIKEDLIELSNIKYGLFNVDEWKKILSDVLSKKVEEFELKENNREQLEEKISGFLYEAIESFEKRTYEKNSSSIVGFFENSVASFLDIFDKIKDEIPVFTKEIVNYLNDPQNKKALKKFINLKIDEYADNTFSKMDYSYHDAIISKYKLKDRSSTISALNNEQDKLQQVSNNYKIILIVIAIFTSLFVYFTSQITKVEFIFLVFISFLFLIIGLSLPMIEIDARVSEIKIILLGEPISFNDQVLYYKSKSIIEVIILMIKQGEFELILVGFLVFMFSVLFPFLKLFSCIILVCSPQTKSNKFVQFFVHKTGKWSMADVMVVAIFMSYIGFSGILTEQLQQLEKLSAKIDLLTTNKSSLQIGFFAFTCFALLSLQITNKFQNYLVDNTSTAKSL